MSNVDDVFVFPQPGAMTAPTPGLTKRELFAAMALQGFLASFDVTIPSRRDAARVAVEFSDALIGELEKKIEERK